MGYLYTVLAVGFFGSGFYLGKIYGAKVAADALALKASADKEVDKFRNIFESR